MMSFERAVSEMPLVAILRGVRPSEVITIAEALYAAGLRLIEVPLNSPDPLDSISRLRAMDDRIVFGAGTVLRADDVDAVCKAGGRLIVSPNTNPAVIRRAVELGAIPFPGFATITEAFSAFDAGARYLKLFPAATYGPIHVKAMKAVLPPEAVVLPVGGVDAGSMATWWDAGARGFGLGSDVYKPGMTPDEVRDRASVAVAAVRALL